MLPLIRWVSDLDLRIRIPLAAAGAVGSLSILVLIVLAQAFSVSSEFERIFNEEVLAERTARQAQLALENQLNAWDDVLRSSYSDGDLDRHRTHFSEWEAETRELAQRIAEISPSQEARARVRRFLVAHEEMGVAYRRALDIYANDRDAQAGDRRVQGIDRAPVRLLTEVATLVGVDIATQDQTGAVRRSAAISGTILLLIVLAATCGTVWMVRSLVRPFDRVIEMADAIRAGHLHRRVDLGRRDEIGRMGQALDDMAEDLQGIADASNEIALGNLAVQVDQVDQDDELRGALSRMLATLRDLEAETVRLTQAAGEGNLSIRGDASRFGGGYAEIVQGINRTLDAVIEPVEESNRVIARFADGDLTARVEGEYRGDHALLKENLNRTGSALKDAMTRMREAAGSITESARELQGTSVTMADAARQTDEMAREVNGASDRASANVEMVANAAEELSGSVREINEQLHVALSVTNEATVRVETTSTLMGELGESSEEIGEVVKVVAAIAEQTNLLALNATIEAARAGEAGKGFAVVASEVKQLAGQTARATGEITDRIRGIQGRTGGAVEGIQEIAEVTDRMSQVATSIASAMEEQNLAIAEIAQNASETSAGTQQVSENIGSVSEAAMGTANGSEQVRASSSTLSQVAGELDELVGAFTV